MQIYAQTSNAEEAEVEQFYKDIQELQVLTPKNDVFFIIRDWNAKVGSQEISGIRSKFDLGVQNEGGQKLIKFCQENTLVIENTLFQNTREESIRGHHQKVNTEIRLIILFAAKDGEALYSQQELDKELTVVQIMNSLLQNPNLK